MSLLRVEPVAMGGKLAARGIAGTVGQQPVGPQPPGEQILAQPDDVDDVEIQADRLRDRTDEHTLAEAADAWQPAGQVGGEDVTQRLQARGRVERVESVQAAQQRDDGRGRVLLILRQVRERVEVADERGEQGQAPRAELVPGGQLLGVGQLRTQAGRERAKCTRGVGVSAQPFDEPRPRFVTGLLLTNLLIAAGDIGVEPAAQSSPATTPALRDRRSQRETGIRPPAKSRTGALATAWNSAARET